MRRAWTLLVLLCSAAIPISASAASRDELWKQVDEAVKKGLPKTAIEHLDPIIAAAIEQKAYAEAIKAIGRKIALEGEIQGGRPEERISRMKAEIAKAPEPMRPAMEAILGHWYWQYFQQNRWRFIQRTATAEAPGDDPTTWDLARILAEIDAQFTKAIAAKESLRKIPVQEYDALLEKGTMPDRYRPTLYDVLAHEALSFYTAGEQAGARAEDAFDLAADSPIFASAEEFIAWNPKTTDARSPTLKAIRLYQDLLRFHWDDADPSARRDADLGRLVFGYNAAFGEEKSARYKAALRRLADAWADHEISSRVLSHLASVFHVEGDPAEAHRIASRGMNRFPESIGGMSCYNLVRQIEGKSVAISTERVWSSPRPTIDIRYRNLEKVFFRLVAQDWEARTRAGRPEAWLEDEERKALIAERPTLAWSADLAPTPDFRERTERIPAPEDVAPGFYILIASHDEAFGDRENLVQFAPVWVSDLALVVRIRHGEGILDGFVLDARTGEPIEGAEVRAWGGERKGRSPVESVRTDGNGIFRFARATQKSYLVEARHGGQAVATAEDVFLWAGERPPRPFGRTIFFTDRSLYRPGQTISYKGIAIRVDQGRDAYEAIGGRSLVVVFADANGKEIARQRHRTNDYGSFAGSFTAPRDRLMGRMSIRVVDGAPAGSTAFRVEEYKRPKFHVSIDPPQAAKLGGRVEVAGKAMAYTGAPIDGAKVRYRVVREVRYPEWWSCRYWWRMPVGESQEIARGSAATAVDGSFRISFVAKPDPSVLEKDEPIFRFTVHADVTDAAGETRSADRVINVGYTALRASLAAAPWQVRGRAVEVAVRTETLDAEGVRAEGAVKVYRLKEPEKVARPALASHAPWRFRRAPDEPPAPDPSNPDSWPLGGLVAEKGFTTDAEGKASLSFALQPGAYRAILATQDRFGKPVTAELPIRVLDPEARTLGIKVPDLLEAPSWRIEPGAEFRALWGSGYERARAFVEIEHRRTILQGYWTEAGATQAIVRQEVTEAMRGGFTLRVTFVRENRAYLHQRRVEVPWTNKDLTVKWERFVSRLEPGRKERWTAIVSGPDAKRAAAEMVATLYDASLDAYAPHGWPKGFGIFRHDESNLSARFENDPQALRPLHGGWTVDQKDARLAYRSLPQDLIGRVWMFPERMKGFGAGPGRGLARAKAAGEEALADRNGLALPSAVEAAGEKEGEPGGPGAPAVDLSKVSARANLNETAFFFPHLVAGEDGVVRIEFAMPEALTEWRFMGFAHDASLRSGYLEDRAVTAKELMVQPNPPRFLREGDVLEFTVKVTNRSAARQAGMVRLSFADARTGDPVDAALGNAKTDLAFDIPSKESRSFSWRLTVPDGMGFLTYKAIGSTGVISDGEEGYLPVLSRRIPVTESLPLPIRGPQTKTFDFARLRRSGESDTLRHTSLVVQMVSNPSWHAVMALPYLMEYPHECSEQVFNRLYANALARHIATRDPRIRRIFEQWKATPTLASPLEKNQDLKSVMLEETPWVRQAASESEARRNVGLLFDDNRMEDEIGRALRKLAEMQRADGMWPWFPGGRGDEYITLYIATGFGRLRHLGVEIDVAPAAKALGRLDAWIDEIYRRILEGGKKDEDHLSPTIALYLYGRSFFLQDAPIPPKAKEAIEYFLGQAKEHWLRVGNRQSQAHLAIALKRFGDRETPAAILRSIREFAVTDEEMGMFWRDAERSWWWHRAPIETQAMMIEAFDEVASDAKAVEACKVWLLKQKQTQDWRTTKATADAVYALLLRGADLLASSALVEVTLGGARIEPEKVEAGTGFYEKRFAGAEVRPALGEITVKKVDPGVAWGSVHWQYLEEMTKIAPYEGTPLEIRKAIFTKRATPQGPVLEPVRGPIEVGDELVVRIELRVDRDMDYIHLKDQRGSGTEPVDVISRYKFQDGLHYYESTRDTASHFFIDGLPKGTYVFEYSSRIVHRGRYQTGMAEIQCMYAPEFNAHSESFALEVR